MCFESPKHSNVRKSTHSYFQDNFVEDRLIRCSTIDNDEVELPALCRSKSAPPITCIRVLETDYSDDSSIESDEVELERNFGYFQAYHLHRPQGEKWRTPKCPVSPPTPKRSSLKIALCSPISARSPFKIIGNTLSTMSRESTEVISSQAQTPRETGKDLSGNMPCTPLNISKKIHSQSDRFIRAPNSKFHQKAIPSDRGINLSSRDPYPQTSYNTKTHSVNGAYSKVSDGIWRSNNYQQRLANYQNQPYYENHHQPLGRNGNFNIPCIQPLSINFNHYQPQARNGNFNIPCIQRPQAIHFPGNNDSRKMLIENIKRNGDLSLQELVDRNLLLQIIRCSEGSRMIQQSIDLATGEQKRVAFDVLIPEINTLSIDPFANYVVQKFFDKGDAIHRPYITRQLMGHILDLSVNMYGCRVIQKAIDYASPDTLIMLVHELNQRGGVTKCIFNQNGNHVIQKLIEKSPGHLIEVILSSVKNRIAELSKHIYGCRVVQKLLKYCQDRKLLACIVMQISGSIRSLCFNEFGNYVVQFLLQHGAPKDTSNVIHRLHEFILILSTDKYGSNVAEKCFSTGNETQREAFINIVLDETYGTAPFVDMVKDEYGNYVIQKMMEGANSDQVNRIIRSYKGFGLNEDELRFAKYIKTRIDRIELDSQGMTPN